MSIAGDRPQRLIDRACIKRRGCGANAHSFDNNKREYLVNRYGFVAEWSDSDSSKAEEGTGGTSVS
jgi:hypothetical protein